LLIIIIFYPRQSLFSAHTHTTHNNTQCTPHHIPSAHPNTMQTSLHTQCTPQDSVHFIAHPVYTPAHNVHFIAHPVYTPAHNVHFTAHPVYTSTHNVHFITHPDAHPETNHTLQNTPVYTQHTSPFNYTPSTPQHFISKHTSLKPSIIVITHPHSVSKRGGCFQRRLCLFVSLSVCLPDCFSAL